MRARVLPVASVQRRSSMALLGDRSGSVGIIFALTLLPAILFVGGAIDFARVFEVRAQSLRALDTAAVAGATAAIKVLASGGSTDEAKTAGDNAAQVFFSSNFDPRGGVRVEKRSLGGNVGAATATCSPTATINVPTAFLRIVGLSTIPVSVSATATAGVGNDFIDVYLMVDISGSMMIGATQKDRDILKAKFGCEFACHRGWKNNQIGYWYGDDYEWAKYNNVALRYDVLYTGVTAFATYLKSVDPSHSRIRLAMYAFDQNLIPVTNLSTDFSKLAANYPSPAIDSSDGDGATHFNEHIGEVISSIGRGGNGSSKSSRRKLLIIATDGVEDPGRQWMNESSLRPQVKGFDMTFCKTLHDRNVFVGILYTPYPPLPSDWGFEATLGQPGDNPPATRLDDIAPAFKNCAGELFVETSDTAAIEKAFVSIFRRVRTARLSK